MNYAESQRDAATAHTCRSCGKTFQAIPAYPDVCAAHPAERRAAWPLPGLWTRPEQQAAIDAAAADVARRRALVADLRRQGITPPWDADLLGQAESIAVLDVDLRDDMNEYLPIGVEVTDE